VNFDNQPSPLRVTPADACVISWPALDHYFGLLKKTLEVNGLMDKLTCIFKMDGSGMQLDHKRVAPKGIKKVHRPTSGNKAYMYVACANTVGIRPQVRPPFRPVPLFLDGL